MPVCSVPQVRPRKVKAESLLSHRVQQQQQQQQQQQSPVQQSGEQRHHEKLVTRTFRICACLLRSSSSSSSGGGGGGSGAGCCCVPAVTALSKPPRPACCTKSQKGRVSARFARPVLRTFWSTSLTAATPAVGPKATSASWLGSSGSSVLCTRWRARGGARSGLVLLASPEQWPAQGNKTRPEGAAQLRRTEVPRPWPATQPPPQKSLVNLRCRAPRVKRYY